MGIKGPLGISLPTQSRQIVSYAKLDFCIFNHQFLALKKIGISSTDIPLFQQEKYHFFHLQTGWEVFPCSLPYISIILKWSWKTVERILRPDSSSSLNSTTYKLCDLGQVIKCFWRLSSVLNSWQNQFCSELGWYLSGWPVDCHYLWTLGLLSP